MRVEPYEFGRAFVQSESSPEDWYLVDLLERHRLGECNCRDYEIRIQAAIDRGDETTKPWCKHIEAVRAMIPDVDAVLFRMAAFEAKCERNPVRFGGRHG